MLKRILSVLLMVCLSAALFAGGDSEAADTGSEKKAVTIEEAKLDEQEQYWLDYFAGVFLGKIKKTENHRYYI